MFMLCSFYLYARNRHVKNISFLLKHKIGMQGYMNLATFFHLNEQGIVSSSVSVCNFNSTFNKTIKCFNLRICSTSQNSNQ